MDPFWARIEGAALNQGDFLPRCLVPIFPAEFGTGAVDVQIAEQDLITVTQSCDLENDKVQFVALCPVHTLAEFEARSSDFRWKGAWESVRQGRREALHLLASWDDPADNRRAVA